MRSFVPLEERPLFGVRVLEALTGPMAAITRVLAELGADVIRLEPEGGSPDRRTGRVVNGISLEFAAMNLGKRAATIDRLDELLPQAHVVVAELGKLDVAALRERQPSLVVMTVSPFGDTDGFRHWQGSDAVIHALSGELSRSGFPDREPALLPGELALACAAAQGSLVLLAGLYNRLATGQGDHLDFSILDGAGQALDPGYGIAGSATAGIPAYKLPRGRPETRMQYPILPCADGYVRICVLAPKQWRGMFEWMGRPEEFADPSFETLTVRFASKTLLPAIAKLFAGKSRFELEREGQSFGVPTAAVLNLEEAIQTDQMAARKAFAEVELGGGASAPFPNGSILIDGERMGLAGAIPEVEEDLAWRDAPLLPGLRRTAELPLSGLKVLDLGVIVVGAESGRLLADLGADVIKIESSQFPDGARQNRTPYPLSPAFVAGHRNKRSMGINLRSKQGTELLLELVRQSDVILSNYKGGTLESLGLDYPTLKEVNPRIIVTDSSAFGSSGPWMKHMGYGPLVRAWAGLTSQWHYEGEPGSFSDTSTAYPDHAGARFGILGVLALLIRRARTGIGGSVSCSQAEIMIGHIAADVAAMVLEHQGVEVEHAGDQPRSAVHACKGDDEWCVVTIRHPRDAQAVEAVTGGTPLREWLAERSPQAAMDALQAAGVPAGAMLRVSELPDFAYYRERGFFRRDTHPALPEPFWIERALVRSERMPDPPAKAAPQAMEHTAAILRERLGLDEPAIAAAKAAGAIELPQSA